MAATTTPTTIIPQPPSMTGDQQADTMAIYNWMSELYNVMAIQSGPLNPNSQTSPAPWDPNNLPEPQQTNLATAQQTANLAWEFSTLINNTLANPVQPPTPGSTVVSKVGG